LLHYGIPAYRLPRAELLREIRHIEGMGVRFIMDTRVEDVTGTMEAGGFDACFVAIGTHDGNHLDIPAADGKQMIDAISLLEHVERGMAPQLGRVVAVVGGGNTAMDAARVAKRLAHRPRSHQYPSGSRRRASGKTRDQIGSKKQSESQ
jgi:NADPH-dependent glutamate synthase beta subunit-like oxidoreductase